MGLLVHHVGLAIKKIRAAIFVVSNEEADRVDDVLTTEE